MCIRDSFLDGRPVETGMQYVPSQTIEVGEMTPSKEIGWVAVNGLLIADQCLLTNVSWDDLDVQGLVFGKEVTVQGLRFKIRLLKVGSKEDVPNEWDAALDAVGEDEDVYKRQSLGLRLCSCRNAMLVGSRKKRYLSSTIMCITTSFRLAQDDC